MARIIIAVDIMDSNRSLRRTLFDSITFLRMTTPSPTRRTLGTGNENTCDALVKTDFVTLCAQAVTGTTANTTAAHVPRTPTEDETTGGISIDSGMAGAAQLLSIVSMVHFLHYRKPLR